MYYDVELYREEGGEAKNADLVLIKARSREEAWNEADEYAYRNGYVDFNVLGVNEDPDDIG